MFFQVVVGGTVWRLAYFELVALLFFRAQEATIHNQLFLLFFPVYFLTAVENFENLKFLELAFRQMAHCCSNIGRILLLCKSKNTLGFA